jgi:Cu2+-exporting ATPase
MTAATDCYHCGLPVASHSPYLALIDGERHAVCCPGCQAVAEAIADGGLSSYYRTRTAFAPRPGGNAARDAANLQIYDRPEVQAGFVRSVGEHTRETTLILDASCAACVWLNQHLSLLPGVVAADANYATRRGGSAGMLPASLIGHPRSSRGDRLSRVAGHFAAAEQVRKRDARGALALFVAGGHDASNDVAAATGGRRDDERGHPPADAAGGLVLTIPVVFYSAAPFFEARGAICGTRLGINVPIALGSGPHSAPASG